MWVIMNYTLHAGSMKQCRHNIFEQNPSLMKFWRKIIAHWACLPSKALITNEMGLMGESASVCKLHCMKNKNYQQHVGLVSSGQQRKVHR